LQNNLTFGLGVVSQNNDCARGENEQNSSTTKPSIGAKVKVSNMHPPSKIRLATKVTKEHEEKIFVTLRVLGGYFFIRRGGRVRP
jgi:hypothetical protein